MFLRLLEEQLKPGRPNCPRYVVLARDELSYKLFCEVWLESWRINRKNSGGVGSDRQNIGLHEWMVPLPSFFHAEKQAMYSLCKEMLDGLGLEELASCAVLSKSQVTNIMGHSHARNNRAVLFNLACSMVIHITDMMALEDEDISRQVENMHTNASRENVTVDVDRVSVEDGQHASRIHARMEADSSNYDTCPGCIYKETTDIITADVIATGTLIRQKFEELYGNAPNGKHFIHTVLLSCLQPTVGFHVISRTGHTDMMDAFWFKQIAILHSSSHLRYQDLSLFPMFFRLMLPTVVAEHLYDERPGNAVLKVLSFTGSVKDGIDRRGWTYVHHDEMLEMLGVRHLKILSVNFINHLQNAASCLLPVSISRALIRYATGASRAFGRRRDPGDRGELPGRFSQFDRNACQWRIVARMLHIMREPNFLSMSHRGAERLTNVFTVPSRMMNIKRTRTRFLQWLKEEL